MLLVSFSNALNISNIWKDLSLYFHKIFNQEMLNVDKKVYWIMLIKYLLWLLRIQFQRIWSLNTEHFLYFSQPWYLQGEKKGQLPLPIVACLLKIFQCSPGSNHFWSQSKALCFTTRTPTEPCIPFVEKYNSFIVWCFQNKSCSYLRGAVQSFNFCNSYCEDFRKFTW